MISNVDLFSESFSFFLSLAQMKYWVIEPNYLNVQFWGIAPKIWPHRHLCHTSSSLGLLLKKNLLSYSWGELWLKASRLIQSGTLKSAISCIKSEETKTKPKFELKFVFFFAPWVQVLFTFPTLDCLIKNLCYLPAVPSLPSMEIFIYCICYC